MATTDLALLPTPDPTAGPDFAGDMAALARAVDPRLNLLASDAADRDTKYGSAPAGTLVSTPDGTQWVRLTDLSWYTLHSVETSTSFTWQSSWTDNGNSIIRCVDGRIYDLCIGGTYSGVEIDAGTGGFIADQEIVSIPSSMTPSFSLTISIYGGVSAGTMGGYLSTGGNAFVADMRPGTKLEPGTSFFFRCCWVEF